jgi:hypothetical protein
MTDKERHHDEMVHHDCSWRAFGVRQLARFRRGYGGHRPGARPGTADLDHHDHDDHDD